MRLGEDDFGIIRPWLGALQMGSNKIPIPTLLLTIFTLLLSGCAGGSGGSTADTNRRTGGMRSGDITVGTGGLADLDLGEDWDISTQQPLPTRQQSTSFNTSANADSMAFTSTGSEGGR